MTAPDPAPPETTAPSALARAARLTLAATLGLFALYLLAALLSFPFGRDQATFAVVGRTIAEGGAPYRDAWDHKTPGIFLVFALAQGLFGQHMGAIRVLEALGLLGLCACFVRWSRVALGSRSAGLAGAVAGIYGYVRLDFWESGNPEGFAGFLLGPAVLLAWQVRTGAGARGRSQPARWLGLGALAMAMAMLKPHLALAIVPVALYALGLEPTRASLRAAPALVPRALRAAGLGAAGSAVVLALVLGWVAALGALDDLWDTVVVFNRGHVGLSWGQNQLIPAFLHAGARLGRLITPLGWLGLVLAARHVPELGAEARAALALVLGLLATLYLTVVLQGKFYIYHYGGMTPWIGLLVGWGLHGFWRRWGGRWQASAAVAVLLIALPSTHEGALDFHRRNTGRWQLLGAHGQARVGLSDALYTHHDFRLGENLLAATWITANTTPEDEVYVWGFEPLLYFLSERRQASRYLFNVPMRAAWSKAEYRRRLMAELGPAPPKVIAVMAGDRIRWVTGNRKDSREELADFPELEALLASRYDKAQQIGDFTMYLRR